MSVVQQYVVTLSRLHLPESKRVQKLIISLNDLENQQFIQNQKIVKYQKVNFYRERVFLRDISAGLCFRIYEINQNQEKILIQSFQYPAQSLSSVSKRAAMFHTIKQDFELIWQCSIFECNQSDDFYDQTNRQYSELKNYFDQYQESKVVYMSKSELFDDFHQEEASFFKRSSLIYQNLLSKLPQAEYQTLGRAFQANFFKQQHEKQYKKRENKLLQLPQLSNIEPFEIKSSGCGQTLPSIDDLASSLNA